jgi:hypothetical protein
MKQTGTVEIEGDPRLIYGRKEDRKAISMNNTKTPEQKLSDGN